MGVIETLQSAFLSGKKLMQVQIITSDMEKSNLGFLNFNSYSMLRAVTKVSVILNLHSTCKAYMIEKIMAEVIWWKLLVCVCWRITRPSFLMRQHRMWTLFLQNPALNPELWREIISIISAPFICRNQQNPFHLKLINSFVKCWKLISVQSCWQW